MAADSQEMFQRWLAAGVAAGVVSAGAPSNASNLPHRDRDINPFSVPSSGLPAAAVQASAPGNEETESIYRPVESVAQTDAPSASSERSDPAAMPPALALKWFRNRVEDLLLIDHVYSDFVDLLERDREEGTSDTLSGRRTLFRFADHLSKEDSNDNLGAFLSRYESLAPETGNQAQRQLDFFCKRLRCSDRDHLAQALKILTLIPAADRAAMCSDDVAGSELNRQHLRWLLPPQDQAMIEGVHREERVRLADFGIALLRAQRGGLAEWLAMFKDGRARQGRRFMVTYQRANPTKGLVPALERLQEREGIESALRVRVLGNTSRVFVGEHRKSSPVQQPGQAHLAQSQAPLVNIGEDDFVMLDVYADKARNVPKTPKTTITDLRSALRRLAEFLVQKDPKDNLRNFLLRYESSDEQVRSRAHGQLQTFIDQMPDGAARANRRYRVVAALETLKSVPVEERFRRTATRRPQMAAGDLMKRLPLQDQQLLGRLRQVCGKETSKRYAGLLVAALTRFGTALVEQRKGGLWQWLDMHDDGRFAEAKQLLDDFLDTQNAPHGGRLPAAVSRLQRLVGTEGDDAIRLRLSRAVLGHPTGPRVDEAESERLNEVHRSANEFADLNELSLSSLIRLPELDPPSILRHGAEERLAHFPAPVLPAMSESNSELMVQRFLAEAAMAAPTPAHPRLPAPSVDQLLRAMSRLRESRRHGMRESLTDTAQALGVSLEWLSVHVTEEGRLRPSPQLQQWLETLPPAELDAILRFNDHG